MTSVGRNISLIMFRDTMFVLNDLKLFVWENLILVTLKGNEENSMESHLMSGLRSDKKVECFEWSLIEERVQHSDLQFHDLLNIIKLLSDSRRIKNLCSSRRERRTTDKRTHCFSTDIKFT